MSSTQARSEFGRTHDPHYPQDDESALCCCEYYNRRGERAHVLGCCCACDELDSAADRLFRGWGVPSEHANEIDRERERERKKKSDRW